MTALWLLAVLVGVLGVWEMLRGEVLFGIVLIVLAFVIGPGAFSVFG